MANTQECGRVLDFILAHPELHSQRKYACGTKMCIAGTALALNRMTESEILASAQREHLDWDVFRNRSYYTSNTLRDEAADILGLPEGEAHALFYEMDNDKALTQLKHYADGGI